MQSRFFWKTWPQEYRLIWYGVVSLFVFSLVFLWFSYFQGASGVIHWDAIQEQKVIETTVHSFRLGPFEMHVPAESYVIFEYFNGSAIHPNTMASYIFLLVLISSAVVLLAVITTIERFWYYVGMALFILFVVGMRLEVLGLGGHYDRLPVMVALLLYVVPSYYFNRYGTSVSFVKRLLVFTGITLLIAVAVVFLSDVEFPMLHLALTGYTPGLILSVLFIILVAHEVFASFVFIVGQGSSKSLQHLSIISVIYLANLLITALHEVGYLHWNFVYINLYLLLTVSAVLGIWGFREREPIYGNIISFYPFGAYFFIAMGAICFSTTGQLLGNANDPALKIIRDAVIYSHTGFGIIFLTYVFSNFVLMLARNIPINKVLYKPNRMPYFTYRFAGTIAMLAFLFVSNWRDEVYSGMSGFYNSAGDLYAIQGDAVYAESLYDQGRSNAFNNHRSNYALGHMKASRYSFEAAHEDYRSANARRPSEYSLANAGNVYLWENDLFSAIETFEEGHERMPKSGVLDNNLGLAYAKIHHLDSAIFYLGAARDHRQSKDAAETNFFAMMAAELIPIKTDSVLNLFQTKSDGTVANALALATLHQEPLTTTVQPLETKRLNLHSATLLNNYVIKNAKDLDTAFTNQAYRIASDSLNLDFSEALKASLAFAYYHQGNVAKALQILAEQVYLSQSYQGKFNYIMGLWALEQGSPLIASSYFSYATTYEYKEAKFYNAIALTEAGQTFEALSAWDTVARSEEQALRDVAAHMKRILTVPVQDVPSLNDADKYQFCRYRIGLGDSVAFNRIVNSFENVNYKAQALLDISNRYYHANLYVPAIRFYNRIAGLELNDERLYDDVRHFELRMLASRKEAKALATQINKNIQFDHSRSLDKMLYTALINEMSGDTASARKNYDVLGVYNPYFEEGIMAAADFFRKQDEKSFKPYTILSEAIQVNSTSYRLLRAYAAEATRRGFDDYAASATLRADDIARTFQD